MSEDAVDRARLAKAAGALEVAREAYVGACAVTAEARRSETAYLNALNHAQREFDKAVTDTRARAGVDGSDWKLALRTPTTTEAA